MKREITGSTYEGGKRIEAQRVTYDKSDDLYALASLQQRYERVCKQLEGATDSKLLDRLRAEKVTLEAEIAEKESHVSGYED